MEGLGDRLRFLRKGKGLIQQEVADQTGLVRATYARYETGDNEPDLGTIRMLARFFNVSAAYLLGETDQPIPTNIPGAIPLRQVPLIGRIVAGVPLYAEENLEGTVPAPEGMDCDFALRVCGDSMRQAGYSAGDIVFCISTERRKAQNGDLVVALVNGLENTLKWLLQAPDSSWYLRAANPKYPDIPLQDRSDRIQAVVVAALRTSTKYQP